MTSGLCDDKYSTFINYCYLELSLFFYNGYLDNMVASLVAQMVKGLPKMRETRVQSLGREDLLEKEMATHSSILTWKIPWMVEPGRLQSMGSQRVGHNWATSLSLFTFRQHIKNHGFGIYINWVLILVLVLLVYRLQKNYSTFPRFSFLTYNLLPPWADSCEHKTKWGNVG